MVRFEVEHPIPAYGGRVPLASMAPLPRTGAGRSVMEATFLSCGVLPPTLPTNLLGADPGCTPHPPKGSYPPVGVGHASLTFVPMAKHACAAGELPCRKGEPA
jgi:hypothetical protein